MILTTYVKMALLGLILDQDMLQVLTTCECTVTMTDLGSDERAPIGWGILDVSIIKRSTENGNATSACFDCVALLSSRVVHAHSCTSLFIVSKMVGCPSDSEGDVRVMMND